MSDRFLYLSGSDLAVRPERVFRVTPGLSRSALMVWYAEHLDWPYDDQPNWDAFEDILRDLSWLPGSEILVYHADLPCAENEADRRTYLDILREAMAHWSAFDERAFRVAFATACRDEVARLQVRPAPV